MLPHAAHRGTARVPRVVRHSTLRGWLLAVFFGSIALAILVLTVSSMHRRTGMAMTFHGGVEMMAEAVCHTHQQQLRSPHQQATMQVLVTGAAGFIGFHAAANLARAGHLVVGLDNFNSYYPVSLKRARARFLQDFLDVLVVDADLNDAIVLQRLFTACRFTHVLHLAAQAGVRHAAKDPLAYVSSNVAGTVSLLEAMVRPNAERGPPALVFASSSSVYGQTFHLPFTEDDPADRPASLYAATKRSTELIVHAYHALHRFPATGLRFFTVYGPWGRPDMSVMIFCRRILQSHPLSVFQGPGATELARDFTYIDDIVSGVMGAINWTRSGPGPASFAVFNLGSTKPVAVTSMVRALEKALNRQASIKYLPMPQLGDVLQTHANISAAAAAFGYAPQYSLNDGMKHFATWYMEYYGADGTRMAQDELQYSPD